MEIKDLLRQAVNAQIQGKHDVFEKVLRDVITQKTSRMVAEETAQINQHGIADWRSTQFGSNLYGPYDVEIQAGQVEGLDEGLYEMSVRADVDVDGTETAGTYSSRASSPDEYYGMSPDFNVQVIAVQISEYGESEARVELTGPEADALVDESVRDSIVDEFKGRSRSSALDRDDD